MAHVNINGRALEYRELGKGEPVIFVHGSASDYRTWQLQQEAFPERFRMIEFSRRYHWPNDPIPDGADYSMDEHVSDLQALVRSLDAAPAHLVGHSYGGFLCLLLAMRQPSLVRTLVLAEPPVITVFVSNTPKPLSFSSCWQPGPARQSPSSSSEPRVWAGEQGVPSGRHGGRYPYVR
jgi:non-heme chloroperoxidase